MVQMLGVFAEFEREMIVERTKLGLAKKASKGEWTGGTPPFGYRYLPERRILVPLPSDARVVTEIFERYVERRSGSVAVSNWLNDSRRLTRRGSRWTPKTVLDVLRNATYTGKLPFNGDLYQAKHEPIIDEQTFERAQKFLELRAESLPSRAANASDYLLTGLLQCVRCGHGFIGTSAHGRGGVYRYYTCFSRQRHGTARCDQERIPADPLEEAIVAEALAALDDGSIFLEAASKADAARTAARSDEVAERRELSAEVASKREATDRYLKAFETGELPPSACAHRLEELHKGIEALEKRRAALEAELAETTTALSKKDLVRLKHEIGAALLGAGPEQVKELLSVVVSEIRVECRSSIQPFFVAPGVRTPAPKRRRTGIEPAHRGSPSAPVLKTGRDTSPLSPPRTRATISLGPRTLQGAPSARPPAAAQALVALDCEQGPLEIEPRRVASEAPVCSHDAMTGDDDRHGVGTDCSPDRPGARRLGPGQLAVARELPEAHRHQPLQNPARERSRQRQVHGDREGL